MRGDPRMSVEETISGPREGSDQGLSRRWWQGEGRGSSPPGRRGDSGEWNNWPRLGFGSARGFRGRGEVRERPRLRRPPGRSPGPPAAGRGSPSSPHPGLSDSDPTSRKLHSVLSLSSRPERSGVEGPGGGAPPSLPPPRFLACARNDKSKRRAAPSVLAFSDRQPRAGGEERSVPARGPGLNQRPGAGGGEPLGHHRTAEGGRGREPRSAPLATTASAANPRSPTARTDP
jgi:hypothetical protein